jgi:hypothetical protein
VTAVLRSISKEAFVDSFHTLYERFNNVLWRMAIILNANEVNLFVSSVLLVFWYHSPNVLDMPRMYYCCHYHFWGKWNYLYLLQSSVWPTVYHDHY